MTRLRAAVVVLAALAGAGLSWALLAAHHGEGTAVGALCGETTSAPSGCDVVNRSPYASVGGIPLAALGLRDEAVYRRGVDDGPVSRSHHLA